MIRRSAPGTCSGYARCGASTPCSRGSRVRHRVTEPGERDPQPRPVLDGVTYTIDLSDKNAGKLRKALDPYLTVASRVGRSSGRIAARGTAAVASRSNRDQNQAIREWAGKNGYEVSERGRIPSSIVEAFHSKR
jgi:hypothetical protein